MHQVVTRDSIPHLLREYHQMSRMNERRNVTGQGSGVEIGVHLAG